MTFLSPGHRKRPAISANLSFNALRHIGNDPVAKLLAIANFHQYLYPEGRIQFSSQLVLSCNTIGKVTKYAHRYFTTNLNVFKFTSNRTC